MKGLLKIISPNHSLATRLTLWVILTILVIFIILSILVTIITRKAMINVSTQNALSRMETANEKINSTFICVETAVENVVPEVENSLKTPDRIYQVLTKMLELNPSIVGSAVAFEPYYYPSKGEQFSPYAYKTTDSTIHCKQLGTSEYEYHQMDWYKIPKLQNKRYWSDPYYDKGGGEQLMTTYSRPLYDKNHQLYAIMTADISVEWLTDMMRKSDINFNEWLLNEQQDEKGMEKDSTFLYKHAYSFIIGRGGTYITHPEKERILNETFIGHSLETPDSADDEIGYKMQKGLTGIDRVNRDGTDFVMAYAPIERTGWSMATVIPAQAITHKAQVLGYIILMVMILGVVVIYIVCRTTLRHMLRPLERFSRSAKEIAKGHFDTPLPEIKTKDEMKELYDSFNTMQTSLTDRIEELKAANEQKGRIEGELQTARHIQMSMIPKTFPAFPERTDIDIFATLKPAKEVGGDLYDFFIRHEKLYMCIGDVSGKGVPASLLMAVTRSLFRTVTNNESNPAKITSLINNSMTEENVENMFVTLFIGVLDLPTGQFNYCSAGHCEPIIMNTEAAFLPCNPNAPVGIDAGFGYKGQETVIMPGSTIFLYTDGLTEAEDVDKKQFGEKQMLDIANRCIKDSCAKPNVIINEMENAVHSFVKDAEPSDDLTMMAVCYTKQEEKEILRRTLVLPNDIETIPQMSEFVEEVCDELNIDMQLVLKLNLAIEEAVVNVMQYAYPQDTQGKVEIEAIGNERRLKVIIRDYGIPFDPTKKERVDITLSAEERPIGGLGIHLVRKIMDSVNYEYTNNMNILTLRKNLK